MGQLLIHINKVEEDYPFLVLLLGVRQVLHLVLFQNPRPLKVIEPSFTQFAQTDFRVLLQNIKHVCCYDVGDTNERHFFLRS